MIRLRLILVALFLVIAIVLFLHGYSTSTVDAAPAHQAKNCTFINDSLSGKAEQAQPDWAKMSLEEKVKFVQNCRG